MTTIAVTRLILIHLSTLLSGYIAYSIGMVDATTIIMNDVTTAQYKIFKDGMYIITVTGLDAAIKVYKSIGATHIERI